MKHSLPIEKLGPMGPAMAGAVQACVHCGFCLPTCPTYQVMGEEMDSPRGRIVLMKQVLEGAFPLAEALPHVDRCLGCLACETACPSGVPYRDLISPFRAWAEERRDRPPLERLRRWMMLSVLPYPERFRWAARLGRVAALFQRFMPAHLRAMLSLLPPLPPRGEMLQESNVPPVGVPMKGRVALLAGCAQQVLAPGINEATLRVLLRQGVEVIVPRHQECCGALGWHVGEVEQARSCARANVEAFPENVDAILTNAAGCGSCLHEYPLLLRGTDEETAARSFARKAQDLSVYLDRVGIVPPRGFDPGVTVALQDACHLLHGQGVGEAPRRLLRAIPGVTLREIAEPEMCCGSAGTYNVDQPETAAKLGRRKAERLIASGAQIALTGNIGCLAQIRMHLRQLGSPMEVMHWVEFLDRGYGGSL